MLTNIPEVKLGIIAVSRDCFIIDLSELRRSAVTAACKGQGIGIYECPVTVENEKDMLKAVEDVKSAGCNALVVFLGTFGPRPQDFFACNAPIKGLYEIGVEIEENSELDLLVAYKAHANAPCIPEAFGFEPCYVNSRLVSRGIPVSCEVDIYGALSEYIGMCVSGDTVTLLDINNSVYRLTVRQRGSAPGLHRPGGGAAGEDPLLRRHRRVCHPGDGPVLPPCADSEALSPPRGGGLRPLRQGFV